jgi:molybdopterin-guanine dinucleotide biosynthesis protein A
MGGLYAALCFCRSPFLLAIGCDKPLFEKGLGEYLAARASNGFDAVVPVTRDGRVQPLCAVYAKSCADVFLRQLTKGDNRMTDALKLFKTDYVPLSQTPYADAVLSNINTPEEYAALVQCSP